MEKAFGNSTMSQKNVYKWYKDFKKGRERVDDLKRPGRPSISTGEQHVNKIKELVQKNRRWTVRDLTDISRQSRSKIKVMLRVFFDYRGVLHYEFLPPGRTVDEEYYLSVMRRLREAIRLKRPDLWKGNS